MDVTESSRAPSPPVSGAASSHGPFPPVPWTEVSTYPLVEPTLPSKKAFSRHAFLMDAEEHLWGEYEFEREQPGVRVGPSGLCLREHKCVRTGVSSCSYPGNLGTNRGWLGPRKQPVDWWKDRDHRPGDTPGSHPRGALHTFPGRGRGAGVGQRPTWPHQDNPFILDLLIVLNTPHNTSWKPTAPVRNAALDWGRGDVITEIPYFLGRKWTSPTGLCPIP